MLFGEPHHGRAPLERAMAAHLIAVLDVGRQCPPQHFEFQTGWWR